MTRTTLQTIFVGTLLFLNDRTSAAPWSSKCIGNKQLQRRIHHYNKYWNGTSISKILAQDEHTCAQAARTATQYRNVQQRSLSPWKHYINHDANRIPAKISFARCLCRGCIFRKEEQDDFNSVLVYSELMVLKKTPCPSNPKLYVVQKDFIQVPVACTCVVPNSVP